MIVGSAISIPVQGLAMPGYLARPDGNARHPAVIVLEGVYGFDAELRRITDLVATLGYVGLAINYFHRVDPAFAQPYSPEGRAAGERSAAAIRKADACNDVSAARDWLNDQPFVAHGRIGLWGFGFGGAIAFVTATLPGIAAAVAFYGQSTAALMPSGEAAPLEDASALRAPLLLVFGGRDTFISASDVDAIVATLDRHGKAFELQTYPNVGHSFFRDSARNSSTREAADAWGRVSAFFGRHLGTASRSKGPN